MKSTSIPTNDSIQELAAFWATHDLTDFEDQLEEVRESVFERQQMVRVPLAKEEARAVEKIATLRGVPSAELIREWVIEKITA